MVQAGAKLTAGSRSGERRQGSGAGWRSSPRDTCTAVDAGAGVAAGGERELKEKRRMKI